MSYRVPYRRASDGAMREHYPPSFAIDDLRSLAAFLATRETTTLLETARRRARGHLVDSESVALRHDVDHNLEHAVRFARWEAKLGIVGSYYVLPEAWYWSDFETTDRLREIVELGHEVGLHSNVRALAWKAGANPNSGGDASYAEHYEKAAEILRDQLYDLRTRVGEETVRGTAAHGDVLWYTQGMDNALLYAVRPLSEFGLEYEAYALSATGARYVTDNRGTLSPALEETDGRQTHLVLHPEHWEVPE